MGAGTQLLKAGRLLVANPKLTDPNFDRTVVMLVAYGIEGALGLVLNRPSDMAVSTPLPQWAHFATEPAVMFLGGPVAHQAVICLARSTSPGRGHPATPTWPGSQSAQDPSPDPTEIPGIGRAIPSSQPAAGGEGAVLGGWKQLDGDLGTLDLEGDPDAFAGRIGALRVFAGYAGWAAGQLEGEIESGAWWVLDAAAEDPFSAAPGTLWKRVLLRQREPLRLVAFYPDNPVWN
ncbi:MAG: YqgE/AlgH family protein [Acidimicrobiales bacterium]